MHLEVKVVDGSDYTIVLVQLFRLDGIFRQSLHSTAAMGSA
jgi:hypothetical protein